MSSEHAAPPAQRSHSGAVSVGSNLGGLLLSVAGVFNFVQGLVAVTRSPLYVVTTDYLFRFDPTTWGWIHLILGAVAFAIGVAIFVRATAGLLLGVLLAVLLMLANFISLPYYPLWSALIIALNVFVAWALTTQLRLRD
ncbi:MAG TPA: hypothetical protein VM429_08445 [Micropruina sp.]|jgi:hypothetical protein|nr:hypothetical protein [Micropruina sp.]